MSKLIPGCMCAVIFGAVSTSWGALGVVVSEDFESYADTSAMQSTWYGFDATLENTIDDDQDGTNEVEGIGNFAFHPGGSVNILDLTSPIVATPTEWIRLTVDIYDNATHLDASDSLNPDNKRMSLGMRSNSTIENIIELGMYNNPRHFVSRAVLFNSINGTFNPSWQAWDMGTEIVGEEELPVNRFRGGAWYTYQVTVKPDSLVYEFDIDYDGTFDYTIENLDILHTAAGFDQLRFGGPSGITSSGGGVTFDNIVLEVVAPEPGSLSLLGLGGLAMLRRRIA